ncbi:glucosaminidase domain-containing protein [Chitinophaga sp. CF418]|uniref:glucosaminidase domain-containing protein n=1 Tax=Chitinophaga sp. CF418 TaxID=1855287 RepID=UPI000918782A|nr:glucosaminidase domain-containing protein [Chitinophaga sp. CF418]SHM05729.1 Flagellum-specific peptidoglycan hydrolase FlgJ [Chitinophaga sp. CF418]
MQLRRSVLVCSFLFGCMPMLKAQQLLITQQYIAKYKDIAITEMQRSGVPASIKLAQGILETQSGGSWLVQNSNNHFGIKCKNNWTGESVRYDDDARQECFRKYPSAADSYKDHSDFLRNNPRYAFLFQFQEEDYKSWAYGLKQAGYATSNTYPQQLIKLIEDYNLQQYTLEGEGVTRAGTGNAKTGDEVVASKPVKTPVAGTGKSSGITKANAPKGVFQINDRKVILVPAGTSLIQIADQRDIKLRNLVHYNDLPNDDPLPKETFIFLQKKGKSGKNDYHTVAAGETMYDIAQSEGIQLRWLRRRNKMKEGQEPEVGERLALAGYANKTPGLAKNAPVEDPTEGDLNPGQIVEDVRTEMERQQEIAEQNAAQQQQSNAPAQQNNLPPGMVDDLKKIGEVKPTGGGAAQSTPAASKPATPPASSQPVYSSKPATTQPSGTQPAAPAQSAPASSQPVYSSKPAPATTQPSGTQPAAPAQSAPASSQPVYSSKPAPATTQPSGTQPAAPAQPAPASEEPAAPVVTTSPAQPAGAPSQPADASAGKGGPIRDGNSLYHEVQTKETLYAIAKRYNVTVEQLQQWNHLENFDIKIGQRLLVGKI